MNENNQMHEVLRQNTELIKLLYKSIESQNFKEFIEILSDDIIYHATGICALPGVYKGKNAVAEIGKISLDQAKRSPSVKIRGMGTSKNCVAAIYSGGVEIEGKRIDSENLIIYKIKSGKVSEIFEFIEQKRE